MKPKQTAMWLGLETEAQRLPKKSIQYAYPTSPSAEKYAGGRGCYLVYPDTEKRTPIVFACKQKAIKFFDSIGYEIDRRCSFTRENQPDFFNLP